MLKQDPNTDYSCVAIPKSAQNVMIVFDWQDMIYC